jgi:hypothetical protein
MKWICRSDFGPVPITALEANRDVCATRVRYRDARVNRMLASWRNRASMIAHFVSSRQSAQMFAPLSSFTSDTAGKRDARAPRDSFSVGESMRRSCHHRHSCFAANRRAVVNHSYELARVLGTFAQFASDLQLRAPSAPWPRSCNSGLWPLHVPTTSSISPFSEGASHRCRNII